MFNWRNYARDYHGLTIRLDYIMYTYNRPSKPDRWPLTETFTNPLVHWLVAPEHQKALFSPNCKNWMQQKSNWRVNRGHSLRFWYSSTDECFCFVDSSLSRRKRLTYIHDTTFFDICTKNIRSKRRSTDSDRVRIQRSCSNGNCATMTSRYGAYMVIIIVYAVMGVVWQLSPLVINTCPLQLLDERIRSSTHGQQLLELQELEKSIQEQENAKQEAMQKEKVRNITSLK